MDFSDWSEYTHKDGRKYYYNTATKETTWKIPDEFADIVESLKYEQEHAVVKSQPMILNFETKEEAQQAWINMLESVGCNPDWTWEECIRNASGHSVYRALKTVVERRECFEEFCVMKRRQEKESKLDKIQSDEQKLRELFEKHDVSATTRFRTAQLLFQNEKAWAQATHRRSIFYDYVDKLKNAQKSQDREIRKSNLLKLKKVFQECVTLTTSYKDKPWAQHTLFRSDPTLSKMDPMDLLIAFEDYIMALDSEFHRQRNTIIRTFARQDRKQRDAFKKLLRQHANDLLRVKWKDFYPIIKDTEAYIGMLETLGSTPLELFWDLQVDLEQDYKRDKKILSSILKVFVIYLGARLQIGRRGTACQVHQRTERDPNAQH